MRVLFVTFQLRGMSDAEYRAACEPIAAEIQKMPGLMAKTWLYDAAAGHYGGVYLWRDAASVEAYKQSPIWQGMLANPHFTAIRTAEFDTIPSLSALTDNLAIAAA